MLVRISKWGNSLGLRLPRSLADQIGVGAGAKVEILAEGDRLVVQAAKTRRTIEDMIVNMTPQSMSDAFDWGEDVGRERVDD
jgi:antitoxin MazE